MGQCAAFVESKLSEVQQVENDNDDYEDIADATDSPIPLGTCEEAYDKVCDEGYGSYTCGERVEYVFEHPLRQNAYMNAIGETLESLMPWPRFIDNVLINAENSKTTIAKL